MSAAYMEFVTHSAEETARLGQALGQTVQRGAVLVLSGELGAGKTVLAKGVASGLEIPPDTVQSPTFAIARPYTGRLPLWHFDLFRLAGEHELAAIGFTELVDEAAGVYLVEWGESFPAALPADFLQVTLQAPDPQASVRHIACQASGPAAAAWLACLSGRLAHSGEWPGDGSGGS